MRRREFIALLGSAAIAWPQRTLTAQTQSKTYRVGLLTPGPLMVDNSPFGAPLIRGLAKFGYVQGRNLAFERRAAEGQLDRLPRLVEELVAAKVDVIVPVGFPPTLAVKQGTAIPTVAFAAGDPVATGLVASLARPGGNLTGISDLATDLTAKRLELLRDLMPKLRRVAMLWNASDLGMTLRYRAGEEAAKVMGIVVQPLGVREPDDFEQAFAAMNRETPDAILMVADSLTTLNRKRVFDFATTRRLPAIYEFNFLVRDGGLMSYSMDLDDGLARVASLVDKVLKGARPADLPFEQPTRFHFAINLKTAKAQGLDVPATLLARANEVIE
jgi:putative tryptophan/tyrosine transport system substrate-binding protein